jgi:transcriptional regulator with XRE-family HTH domain
MAQTGDRPPEQSEEVLRTVANRIREARIRAGLTQKQLGEKLGRKQAYIFELETGANITLRTLARMADVFGMDARDFLPESRSEPLSAVGLDQLLGPLQRLADVLIDRQAQEERRLAQDAEILAELRALADLRSSLERMLKSQGPGRDP